MKANAKNERIKRKYLTWLREARGLSEATVSSVEKAIWRHEDFTGQEDFSAFSQNRAVAFKKWLQERKHNSKPISTATAYHCLRHLKEFFTWLSGQPGFKRKISLDCVSYLSLNKKKVREATAPKPVRFPSFDYVLKLAESIQVNMEIDQRDRALIAFLLLSGMRDKAVTTLPIGCFDPENLEIQQDPQKGVQTKFGKRLTTRLFRFDDRLLMYILEWFSYLRQTKLFGDSDPLFPRSKVEQPKGTASFESVRVEPAFWKSAGPMREILKTRSKRAGLDYYPPHSFRHAAIHIAMKCCRTAEEIKAMSQNLGHENVSTTLMTYGTLDQFRVSEILSKIDFSPTSAEGEEAEIIEDVVRKLLKLRK